MAAGLVPGVTTGVPAEDATPSVKVTSKVVIMRKANNLNDDFMINLLR
jgi:hypothetical protein